MKEPISERIEGRLEALDFQANRRRREAKLEEQRQLEKAATFARLVAEARSEAVELAALLKSRGIKPDTPLQTGRKKKYTRHQKKGWFGQAIMWEESIDVPIFDNFWLLSVYTASYTPKYVDNDPGRYMNQSHPAYATPGAHLLDKDGNILIARGEQFEGDTIPFLGKDADKYVFFPQLVPDLGLRTLGIANDNELVTAYNSNFHGHANFPTGLQDGDLTNTPFITSLEMLGVRQLG